MISYTTTIFAGTDNSWHVFEDGNEPSNLNDSGLTAPENRNSTDYTFSAFDAQSDSAQGESVTISLPNGGSVTAQGGSASATASATSIVNIRMEWPKTPVIQGTVLRSLNNRYQIVKEGYETKDTNSTKVSGYRPKIEDIGWITGKVGQLTNKWVMYTGDFNNSTTPINKGNGMSGQEANEVDNTTYSREQTILGEDIYMYDYTCNFDKLKLLNINPGTNDDRDPDEILNTAGAGMIKEYYFGKEDKTISTGKAIQAMYKAIGAKKYFVSMFQMHNFKYGSTKNKNLMTTETPFINNVQDAYTDVDYRGYYTYTYLSRTQMEYYLQRAYFDGVTEDKLYNSETRKSLCQKKSAKDKVIDNTEEKITVIDFCHYLKNLLYVNGEPELTDKESTAILTFYGRTLPQSLTDAQLEDVKYLLARGIIDSNLDFTGYLSVPEMMQILMRAADPGSRLTFKQMQIVYNEDLTSKGYYPVELNTDGSTVSSVKVDPASIKAIGTYDYFVAIDNFTQFSAGNCPYVSNEAFETRAGAIRNSETLEGSYYMGIVNNHYWFKVPVNVPAKAMGSDKDYITIAFTQKNDSVKYYKLQLGGGYYESPQYTSGKQFVYYNRRAFNINQYPKYIDKNSKQRAQNTEDGTVLLADTGTKTFKLKITNPSQVKFCEQPLSDFKADAVNKDTYIAFSSAPVKPSNATSNEWTFVVKDIDGNAAGYLADMLTASGDGSGAINYLSYMKTDKTVLADTRFLKTSQMGDARILSITKLDQETDLAKATYRIETKYENIIVNNNDKKVIRGQSIMKFDSSADLMVPQTKDLANGVLPEFYIDCRVLLGVVDNFLVLTGKSDSKSLIGITAEDVVDISYTAKSGKVADQQSFKYPIYNLNGNASGVKASFMYIKGKAADNMQIELTYPEANYFIYYTNVEESSNTYLVVLMCRTPLTEKYDTDREKKISFLYQTCGYTLQDNEYATIYNLKNSSVSQAEIKIDGMTIPTIDFSKSGSCITSSKAYGLLYKIPDIKDFSYTDYVSGTSTTNPLPIVGTGTKTKVNSQYDINTFDTRYLNVNVNAPAINPNEEATDDNIKLQCYRTVYSSLMSTVARNILNCTGVNIVFNSNGKGYSTTAISASSPNPTTMLPAPIGVQRFFTQTIKANLPDIVNNKKGKIFYGSACGEVKAISDSIVYFCINDKTTFPIQNYSSTVALSAFVSSNPGQTVYVITDMEVANKLTQAITQDEILQDGLNPVPTLTPGGTKKYQFDFDAYNLNELLENADGILTVLYLVLLGIVPRGIFFIFLALACLSLVSGAGIVRWFCDNILDVFKFFSFGRIDVETVKPLPLFITTFVSLVFISMLNNETLVMLLNWLSQSITRLLGH